jgi:hypothetical protein
MERSRRLYGKKQEKYEVEKAREGKVRVTERNGKREEEEE